MVADEDRVPSIPKTMRAGARHRYGDSSVLEVIEVETPPVASRTVMVEVVSAALNPLDWHMMTGTPWLVRLRAGLRRPKGPIIGVDFAGRVVAVGDGAAEYEPGEEVAGVTTGACAQYVATSADRLVPKPTNVTFDEAAGMGVAGVTALQGLRDKGEVKSGQKVLINGAAGGVGTAAVQLAKWMGAEVTAVCSTRNVELVRSLGADRVVDYTADDFTATDERYHVIFDNQGNRPLRRIRQLLTDDGVYLLVGGPKKNRVFGPVGHMIHALIRFQFSSKSVRSFIADERKEDIAQLASLMESGNLRTIVDTVYPLDDIAAAMDKLAEGHVRGKVIIKP